MSRLPRELLRRVQHVAVGDDQLVLQRGVGRIEAERGGRPGLGEEPGHVECAPAGDCAEASTCGGERPARRGRAGRELMKPRRERSMAISS